MRPNKPRPPTTAAAAHTRGLQQIAEAEGRPVEEGPAIAADFEGCSPSLLRKAADPDLPEDITFKRVSRLTRHFGATAWAEHLALCARAILIPLPDPDAPGRWGVATGIAAKEFGEAVAEILRATNPDSEAGGEVSRSEARQLIRDIDDVLRVVAELRGMAVAAAGDEPT